MDTTNNIQNIRTAQPFFMLFTPDKKTIAPVIETCLHFARLAEVAAIAGVQVEAVQYTIAHVASLLDDLSSTKEAAEDHAPECAAVCEYAENALNAILGMDNLLNHDDCGAIHLLVISLADLQERVARYARYDLLGADFGGAV